MTNGEKFRIQKKTLFGWSYLKSFEGFGDSGVLVEMYSENEVLNYIKTLFGTSSEIDRPWIQYVRMK